ncbi:hypothetical protein C1645_749948 [Glomus cerebriforme]|uniref:Uncharacterized protein n=1 Tax=Glomus cerebriforme TaxID=658196 RepID=A0A397TKH4_9GLOM|nr:hypothetical protein C1645_749948 [Glomus cerebriforme]
MAQRVPLRAFFKTKTKPNTLEEARNIYLFFASKGELLEFKFARDSDIKKIKDHGWISYKDSKITEQLFENWFKIEPCNIEAIVSRSEKGAKELINQRPRPLPPIFGGFYLKDNETSSSILDQTNNNFSSANENNQRENMTIEEVIEETIEDSENQKESLIAETNFIETIIESTATTIETRAESQ